MGWRGQHKRRLGLGVTDSTVHLENSELQLDWSTKWGREVSKHGAGKIESLSRETLSWSLPVMESALHSVNEGTIRFKFGVGNRVVEVA